MSNAAIELYETLTDTEQKEVFDFMNFIITKRKSADKQKCPLEQFAGLIDNEDAKTMSAVSDGCQKIDFSQFVSKAPFITQDAQEFVNELRSDD